MKVLVSACLLGENCRYDGGNNFHGPLFRTLRSHEVVSVCPEVLGGLPTPRIPCEIAGGCVVNKLGEKRDEAFVRGAQAALGIALNESVKCAVLAPRSPSCGVHEVYDGSFSGKLVSGEGVFAALLRENGIPAFEPDELFEQGDTCVAAPDADADKNPTFGRLYPHEPQWFTGACG